MASGLFLLQTCSLEQTKDAFSRNDFTIHFYNNAFIIGGTDAQLPAAFLPPGAAKHTALTEVKP